MDQLARWTVKQTNTGQFHATNLAKMVFQWPNKVKIGSREYADWTTKTNLFKNLS